MDALPQPNPDAYLNGEERTALQRLLSTPEEFPREFGAWIVDYLALNGSLQPFQVEGLSLTGPRSQSVLTAETRGWDSAYGDLATVGPQFTDLGSGTYLFLFSCEVQNTEAGVQSSMSVSINGSTAVDGDGVTVFTSSTSLNAPITRFLVLTLPLPKNTVKCQYKREGSGVTVATFRNRNIIAIRLGS
jgi:hypothetical protein